MPAFANYCYSYATESVFYAENLLDAIFNIFPDFLSITGTTYKYIL